MTLSQLVLGLGRAILIVNSSHSPPGTNVLRAHPIT
jgi:hypothetical protein